MPALERERGGLFSWSQGGWHAAGATPNVVMAERIFSFPRALVRTNLDLWRCQCDRHRRTT